MQFKKKLSTTQLAKCWINSKLEASRINVELEELQDFTEQTITDEQLDEIRAKVSDELAKYKVKFEEYVNNYCVL